MCKSLSYTVILILIPIIILWDKYCYTSLNRLQCWNWVALSALIKLAWILSGRARSLTPRPPLFHLYHPVTTVMFDWGRQDLVVLVNTLQTLEGPSYEKAIRLCLKKIFFYWSTVDLKCCISFRCTVKSVQSVQLLSHVQLLATPWTAACQASLSITNSQSFLKLISIESVMPSSQLILCCSLLLLPSIFPSIRVFSNESVLCIRWQKYWSFSFSISLSSEYSGLISFEIDWLDLLSVQGTLKSLLQHHSWKASILELH